MAVEPGRRMGGAHDRQLFSDPERAPFGIRLIRAVVAETRVASRRLP
jgi:hypothetical protein